MREEYLFEIVELVWPGCIKQLLLSFRFTGAETVQERGADGEHRLAVDRRPCQRRQG